VGKKIGRRGIATLFATAKDGNSLSKIDSGRIVGAGTNVFPGYGANSNFIMQTGDLPTVFLVCVTYFDEPGAKYEQAFEFERGSTLAAANYPIVKYDQMATPDPHKCDSSN
jgi:hypothetical protein